MKKSAFYIVGITMKAAIENKAYRTKLFQEWQFDKNSRSLHATQFLTGKLQAEYPYM